MKGIRIMRKLILTIMVLVLAAGCSRTDERKIVWSDEFNYSGLPDSSKWDYEEGFIRNNELQYYTRARKENAHVENGLLVIEGRMEKIKNSSYKHGSNHWQEQPEFAQYTAASLITLNRASWRYGRIEVRAKLPQGKGVWPAIWTLGVNHSQIHWPGCGEIDIMEYVGKEPDRVHATVHYDFNGKHQLDGENLQTDSPYADFHIYAIEWFPDRIEFFFDKTLYHTFLLDKVGKSEDNPFRKPHYILINLALGGSWGGPIDDAILPQKYQIDYIRVYEPMTNQ
jgi:beta-glucanase (GH16 family)